ncbi:stage VI sporulation protein D [Peribacillus kribbensis]|uniref:stage VI sporulation protein D n=1 Tax=Peribacillus kribbensis TaxID=356658 RepID=UPI00041B8D40|nr:stage VI sporulation protein D [Peribacillus kribbensis]
MVASENQSLLRFSVEESIWFQKGQEVNELYSLSLDPHVTVQDMEQYVVIKGELHLAGEYKREQPGAADTENESFSFVSPRTISYFEEREDGLYEFQHRFPVDITIPANRISSLEEVNVAIASFDYSMPEKNCLTLCAELMISGIYGDQQSMPGYAEEGIEEVEEMEEEILYRSASPEAAEVETEEEESPVYSSDFLSTPERSIFVPFEAEAKRTPEAEEPEEPAQTYPSLDAIPSYEELPLLAAEDEREDVQDQDTNPFQPVFTQEESSIIEAEEREEVKLETEEKQEEPVVKAEEMPVIEEPVQEYVHYEEASFSRKTFSSSRRSKEAEEEAGGTESGKNEGSAREKQGVSLTDFFARKEEQAHTKVKVCLVQQGDTLNSLASRYEINANAILALNELDSANEITQGQVLYIPVKQVSQKR